MKRWILGLCLLQLSAIAFGKEYGHYDVTTVLSITGAGTPNPQATLNVAYLNQILDDLGSHAGTWPPQFDSAEDRRRAEHDVTVLANMLDTLAESFSHNPSMLLRLAVLHGFGHNLDIPGAAEKAEALFIELLALTPDDPQANFRFGVFYAVTVKRANAIPYLEKAKALGVANADYWLGVTYMSLGDNAKAIENLTSYTNRVPTDTTAAKMLDAVRNGKVQVKQGLPPGTSP
jgi:predicted Zn-dependent protease